MLSLHHFSHRSPSRHQGCLNLVVPASWNNSVTVDYPVESSKLVLGPQENSHFGVPEPYCRMLAAALAIILERIKAFPLAGRPSGDLSLVWLAASSFRVNIRVVGVVLHASDPDTFTDTSPTLSLAGTSSAALRMAIWNYFFYIVPRRCQHFPVFCDLLHCFRPAHLPISSSLSVVAHTFRPFPLPTAKISERKRGKKKEETSQQAVKDIRSSGKDIYLIYFP